MKLGKWLVAALLVTVAAQAEDLSFDSLRYLAVQKDGRKKPLDTVALETVRKLTGRESFVDPATGRRQPAMDVMLSLWLATRDWEQTPIVLLSYKPLKTRLGLAEDQKYFSYKQLATPQLQQVLDEGDAREARKENLTRDDKEAQQLSQRLQILRNSIGLETLAIVPHPQEAKGAWVPVEKTGAYYDAKTKAALERAVSALKDAYVARDAAQFATAEQELRSRLVALSPAVYPSASELGQEVQYNSFHPFRKAWILYLLAFLWTLATWRARGAGWYWSALAIFVAGLAMHSYGFYLRTLISGRPPVTNMYESVVWVSLGAVLFAAILEAIYRQRYYIVGVAPLSAVMLLLADQFPTVMDSSIGPLTPVLRDNFWLTVHVPTITFGYAAFVVALGLGHISIGYYLFAPLAKETIAKLEKAIYRSMQIGVLCIAAGTILGGIWAHYAWGRFWGWDPKETWALITLLCYLVPLHGRLAGWMSNFALTVTSVVCFLPVLMAWYGVNFILGKGLHSYGSGVGGFGYALAFVVVELALVVFATLQRKKTV